MAGIIPGQYRDHTGNHIGTIPGTYQDHIGTIPRSYQDHIGTIPGTLLLRIVIENCSRELLQRIVVENCCRELQSGRIEDGSTGSIVKELC